MTEDFEEFNIDNFNVQERTSLFIQASAGTGKTFTIKKIVRKLVQSGIPLGKILIVTYTEKAVGELKYRIRNELSDIRNAEVDVDNAPIFTIHSFCQSTLKEFSFIAGEPNSLSLVGGSELDDFLELWIRDVLANNEVFKNLFKDSKNKNFIDAIKKTFKAAQEKFYLDENGNEVPSIISLDSREGSAEENFFRDNLKTFYLAWQNEKRKRKLQTFNDMLRYVRESVCKENSLLKEKLTEKYTYAIIDEFQDTNQIQWDIFSAVFLKKPNAIIVVGDPKQSIYAFQGADVNVYKKAINQILQSGGKGYSLGTNRRSSKEMVLACNALFSNKKEKQFSDVTQNDQENKTSDKKKSLENKQKGFQSFFDEASNITFSEATSWEEIQSCQFDGKVVEPFWICGEEDSLVSVEDFSKIAVNAIIECCTFKNGKTRLQVYDRDEKKLRNVTFRDFAVLARTRGEMNEIEAEMTKSGLPFTRYKDSNLFSGLECAQWVSLLNVIVQSDFTGSNRRILSEALFTHFFNVPMENVESERYDNPICEERQKIIIWQKIAGRRNWAELLESIFELSELETSLSRLSDMQSLSKFHQIGNYICQYLYKNSCSLDETVKHLSRLLKKTEDSLEDNNIVAKGTDFHCVQVMTIHASKGLEFPVVISMGGFKSRNNNVPHVWTYHQDGKAEISFITENNKKESEQKRKNKEEDTFEFQRDFYVAYTRAAGLMMLPYYEKFGKEFGFIQTNVRLFMENKENKKLFRQIKNISVIPYEEMRSFVQKILLEQESIEKSKADSEENDTEENDAEKKQRKRVLELSQKIPSRILYKHCYSSLTHGKELNEVTTESNEILNSDEASFDQDSVASYDQTENPVCVSYDINLQPNIFSLNFLKGSKIGIVLHEVFEKADFCQIGKIADENEVLENEEVSTLIENAFQRESFNLSSHNDWKMQTASFLWNVLNAKIPEIKGSQQTENSFSLCDVPYRIAEAEFNMAIFENEDLKNYCNGFIDLVFVRKLEDLDVYSIVDWKSDTFSPEGYSDSNFLKSHTDDKYSIQRVLYSYSLIKWLKTFSKYEMLSLNEIFEKHFGGIYYVYIKGCKKASSNGIYAKTWNSWEILENQFKKICRDLIWRKS